MVHLWKWNFNTCIRKISNSSNDFNKQSDNRYKVHAIPALQDNYMYLMTDKFLNIGIAVDPVEPEKLMKVIESEKVNLEAVLTTHHHFDHAGGNVAISQMVKNLPIYGGDERIDAVTHMLSHDETLKLGDLIIKCLHTPCHTSGHLCYFVEKTDSDPVCFTGDTLFVGGCGRFFEGSAADMLKSLNILAALPLNTKVYCGHEYTTGNLKFALSVEPDNSDALSKLKKVEEGLKQNKPSVPSTIGEELLYNPFLRTDNKTLQLLTKKTDPIEVMAALRKLKDHF
ncbi:hypothetical protein JTE90_017066 [Oedothorax gibbosus]|uniref:hydroxyacylglutathione hydrolase n=1 Tax=Oedothorax gibbosus TaxID=931172 RepID=A0AAV6UNA1_9ARAC|nr:hypothetical protein JTE90_017066 [Oedothorax gibbosus]